MRLAADTFACSLRGRRTHRGLCMWAGNQRRHVRRSLACNVRTHDCHLYISILEQVGSKWNVQNICSVLAVIECCSDLKDLILVHRGSTCYMISRISCWRFSRLPWQELKMPDSELRSWLPSWCFILDVMYAHQLSEMLRLGIDLVHVWILFVAISMFGYLVNTWMYLLQWLELEPVFIYEFMCQLEKLVHVFDQFVSCEQVGCWLGSSLVWTFFCGIDVIVSAGSILGKWCKLLPANLSWAYSSYTMKKNTIMHCLIIDC